MQLNELKDNEGARHRRMRVGRGIGSGKGKTAGRGYKGQTSRSGVAIKGFEGGQMPIHRRLPKRGFSNVNRIDYSVINLSDLQRFLDSGAIKAGEEITCQLLMERGLARKNDHGVKLLAKGELKGKVNLHISKASAKAQEAVKKAGGSVKVKVEAKKPADAEAKA